VKFVKRTLRSRLIWPAGILVVLLVVNVIVEPTFFNIRIEDGHLFGSTIDILRDGAPTILVSLGMTLVIATRGIDLSVGAIVAISGAVACTIIAASPTPGSIGTVVIAVLVAIGTSVLLGAWNGLLVSIVGIQPIVATLILMTAGRGIAMLITQGQIVTVNSAPYEVIGGGYWFALPASILIAAGIFVLTALLTRKSALGMFIESVGINPSASRLAGIRSRSIMWAVYVFSGVCSGVAGLMISSAVTAADANTAGMWIELDAILAVVIGGTSLAGGRYFLTGTVLGALIIQTLTTTIYAFGVNPEFTLVLKAIVVTIVCLAQSPRLRAAVKRLVRRPRVAEGTARG
jgi:ribose/xylose/arabinose/galactoside ABC-type transport system permease subunit